MRKSFVLVGPAAIAALVACSSSSSSPNPQPDAGPIDSGTPTNEAGPTATLALTPASGNLLTCTGKVTASAASTWATTPAGIGGADASGAWVAPNQTPATPAFTLTATSTAGATASGSYTLGTVFPGTAVSVTGSTGYNEGGNPSIGARTFAHNGSRVYATWVVNHPTTATTLTQMVARSDDGGATWKPAVAAINGTLLDAYTIDTAGGVDCPTIAVDPSNADVVYVTGTVPAHSSFSNSVNDKDNAALVFAVSTDGGATFETDVLKTGSTIGACGDIAAPKANAVVVESPDAGCGGNSPDRFLWSDTNRGAAFATGTHDANGLYTAAGGGPVAFVQGTQCSADIIVTFNGGNSGSGQVIESPRFFDDGAGNVCLVFTAESPEAAPTKDNVYVQCSTNAGAAFGTPVLVDPAHTVMGDNQPRAAFGANGAAAVAWTETDGANNGVLWLTTSTDGAKTFGAPVKLSTYNDIGAATPSVGYDANGILYVAYGFADPVYRIAIDKSCDGGKTWSGPVVVDATTSADAVNPALLFTGGAAPRISAALTDHLEVVSLSP